MIILGITGGVGSGKSKVLYDLEKNYGAYIVEADKLAHRLMEPGQEIYKAVVAEFGEAILSKEAPFAIDRGRLGEIVFKDKEKLSKLNSLTHPVVKENIKQQIKQHALAGNTRLFVIEAALLIQDNYQEICDEIWYVCVSRDVRIKRLMDSRGYSIEKCMAMFESQEPDEYYKIYANFTINNDFSYENTSKQLKVRLNKLLSDDIMS